MDQSKERLEIGKMMTTDQVAILLDCAPSTLLAWRNRHQYLAFYRVGRRVLYKRTDVEEFMHGTRVEANPVEGVRVEAANS